MRDYGFDFEKLQEDHPLYPCGACPWSTYCDTIDDDDDPPCEEQRRYNRARALRLSSEY